MDRREALAALAGSGILIKTEAPDDDAKIKGVGVLRYPSPKYIEKGSTLPRDIARMIADFIKPGAVIGLPNDRDEHGAYCWDFRIEGGDMSQVKIERNE